MSATYSFAVEAIDTLMFRDGRPFNQSDAGAGVARSIFPPYPPTLVGAVRMLLACQSGFENGGSWPKAELGDGVDWRSGGQLGKLRFSAPLVLRDGVPLFPVPLFVALAADEVVRLRPGAVRSCDLGPSVRLPEPEKNVTGLKLVENQWLDGKAMTKLLAGETVAKKDLVKAADLWESETRIGIGRDRENRVVNTGQLYLASHVRPRTDVSLGISVSELNKAPRRSTLQALAGEHRMAEFSVLQPPLALPAAPKDFPRGNYFVVLLSPAILDVLPMPNGNLDRLPGKVVSACLGKPVRIGGWDSLRKQPIAMTEAVPAGSVWFLSGRETKAIAALNGTHIGRATEWGFGQILVGKWGD